MSSAAIYDGSLPTVMRTPRRLGSVFAPPRDLYLLYFPLFMAAGGLLCWLIETDTMLLIGSLVLGLISAYMFYDLLVLFKPLRVSTLLVTTLGLAYGLGSANTWLTLPRSGQELGPFLHKDPMALTHAMGSILFVLAIVLALGELVEKPVFGEEFSLQFSPQSIVFISFGFMLLVLSFARGSLNFEGGVTSAAGGVSVFTSLSVWVVGTLFAITLAAALNAQGKLLKTYLILLTLAQFVMEIPLGRRNLIFTLVLAALGIRLGRFRFNWSWTKRIVVGTSLAGLLYVTSIGFFYLRLAGFASGHAKLNLIERISLAYDYYETRNFEEVQKSFSENVQKRTFILGFLSEVEQYSTHFDTGYGRDFAGQFAMSIPSAFYPDKDLNFEEEGLANELFGSVYIDEANSVLTAGIVDFGLVGMVLYPLLVCLMLRAFMEFVGQHLPTFVATFIIFATLAGLLQPENLLTQYFNLIRNGLLFGLIVWFFIALPAFSLRKEAV